MEKCIDDDGNTRCTKPFVVTKSTCYNIEWSTDGKLSHTTAEVRDAGSDEIVFYRDTNGEWTPDKGEVGSRFCLRSQNAPRAPRHRARFVHSFYPSPLRTTPITLPCIRTDMTARVPRLQAKDRRPAEPHGRLQGDYLRVGANNKGDGKK